MRDDRERRLRILVAAGLVGSTRSDEGKRAVVGTEIRAIVVFGA